MAARSAAEYALKRAEDLQEELGQERQRSSGLVSGQEALREQLAVLGAQLQECRGEVEQRARKISQLVLERGELAAEMGGLHARLADKTHAVSELALAKAGLVSELESCKDRLLRAQQQQDMMEAALQHGPHSKQRDALNMQMQQWQQQQQQQQQHEERRVKKQGLKHDQDEQGQPQPRAATRQPQGIEQDVQQLRAMVSARDDLVATLQCLLAPGAAAAPLQPSLPPIPLHTTQLQGSPQGMQAGGGGGGSSDSSSGCSSSTSVSASSGSTPVSSAGRSQAAMSSSVAESGQRTEEGSSSGGSRGSGCSSGRGRDGCGGGDRSQEGVQERAGGAVEYEWKFASEGNGGAHSDILGSESTGVEVPVDGEGRAVHTVRAGAAVSECGSGSGGDSSKGGGGANEGSGSRDGRTGGAGAPMQQEAEGRRQQAVLGARSGSKAGSAQGALQQRQQAEQGLQGKAKRSSSRSGAQQQQQEEQGLQGQTKRSSSRSGTQQQQQQQQEEQGLQGKAERGSSRSGAQQQQQEEQGLQCKAERSSLRSGARAAGTAHGPECTIAALPDAGTAAAAASGGEQAGVGAAGAAAVPGKAERLQHKLKQLCSRGRAAAAPAAAGAAALADAADSCPPPTLATHRLQPVAAGTHRRNDRTGSIPAETDAAASSAPPVPPAHTNPAPLEAGPQLAPPPKKTKANSSRAAAPHGTGPLSLSMDALDSAVAAELQGLLQDVAEQCAEVESVEALLDVLEDFADAVNTAHASATPSSASKAIAQVPVPPQLRPWLCDEGARMLQQYVGVVRAALDRVMAMQDVLADDSALERASAAALAAAAGAQSSSRRTRQQQQRGGPMPSEPKRGYTRHVQQQQQQQQQGTAPGEGAPAAAAAAAAQKGKAGQQLGGSASAAVPAAAAAAEDGGAGAGASASVGTQLERYRRVFMATHTRLHISCSVLQRLLPLLGAEGDASGARMAELLALNNTDRPAGTVPGLRGQQQQQQQQQATTGKPGGWPSVGRQQQRAHKDVPQPAQLQAQLQAQQQAQQQAQRLHRERLRWEREQLHQQRQQQQEQEQQERALEQARLAREEQSQQQQQLHLLEQARLAREEQQLTRMLEQQQQQQEAWAAFRAQQQALRALQQRQQALQQQREEQQQQAALLGVTYNPCHARHTLEQQQLQQEQERLELQWQQWQQQHKEQLARYGALSRAGYVAATYAGGGSPPPPPLLLTASTVRAPAASQLPHAAEPTEAIPLPPPFSTPTTAAAAAAAVSPADAAVAPVWLSRRLQPCDGTPLLVPPSSGSGPGSATGRARALTPPGRSFGEGLTRTLGTLVGKGGSSSISYPRPVGAAPCVPLGAELPLGRLDDGTRSDSRFRSTERGSTAPAYTAPSTAGSTATATPSTMTTSTMTASQAHASCASPRSRSAAPSRRPPPSAFNSAPTLQSAQQQRQQQQEQAEQLQLRRQHHLQQQQQQPPLMASIVRALSPRHTPAAPVPGGAHGEDDLDDDGPHGYHRPPNPLELTSVRQQALERLKRLRAFQAY